MPPNGQLTTAEAGEILQVYKTQLYRWLEAGYLTATLEPTAGRGRALWDAEPVHALAKELGPKRPGQRRVIPGSVSNPNRERNERILAAYTAHTGTIASLARELDLPSNVVWGVLTRSGLRAKSPS